MQNRHLFQRDPTTFSIPNDGVTTVTAPSTPEQWNVLRTPGHMKGYTFGTSDFVKADIQPRAVPAT